MRRRKTERCTVHIARSGQITRYLPRNRAVIWSTSLTQHRLAGEGTKDDWCSETCAGKSPTTG